MDRKNQQRDLRQQERERGLEIGGQPILRFGALCNKRPEKRGHSFLQTMAPIRPLAG
jgi:hypothetical protein